MVTVMSRATRAAGTGGVLFYRRPTIDPVDFSWTSEQVELRARARKVAEEAVDRYGRANDSWINGFSREFSRELAAHGWIGMTWPVEFGGGGRPPIERLIVAEEMISAGAPLAAVVVRRSADGPDAHDLRHTRSGG